jgi:hypothetical protein
MIFFLPDFEFSSIVATHLIITEPLPVENAVKIASLS